MPKKGKGKAKNTVTAKAKYNRLMHQKVNKVKLEKLASQRALKSAHQKSKRAKRTGSLNRCLTKKLSSFSLGIFILSSMGSIIDLSPLKHVS